MAELDNRVAVIVGGSGGIGAQTAQRLAEAGASVVIGYNSNRDKAAALADRLPGTGHSALRIVVDDSRSVADAAEAVRETYGRTDILVNSAGTTMAVPHGDLDGLVAVQAAIARCGSLDYSRARALEYADAADAVLAALPDNAYVDALRGLARYSVSRDH